MTLQTTVGQLIVNQGLPEDLRDYDRVLDKKEVKKLMARVAEKYPDKYSEILRHVMDAARSFASVEGASVSLQHLRTAKSKQEIVKKLQRENQKDIDNDLLSDEEREKRIVARTSKIYGELKDAVLAEEMGKGSPYALQAVSGARGNPGQLSSLVGADLLVADHKNRPVPMPIYSGYAEGLDPVEYWAAGYGTRKGMVDVKFCCGEGTLVLMPDGSSRPIEQIKPGDYVVGSNMEGNTFPVEVINTFSNGVRPVRDWDFSGAVLTATECHEVLASVRSNKNRNCIQIGKHRLGEGLHLGSKRISAAVPSGGEWFGRDEPLAMFYGLMAGDGCVAPSTGLSWTFSCADHLLLQQARPYFMSALFELSKAPGGNYNWYLKSTRPRWHEHTGAGSRTLHTTKLAMFREDQAPKRAHEKVLPRSIWSWSDASIWEYVGGLISCDACIYERKKGASIYLSLTAKELIEELSLLLSVRFGVVSKVSFVKMRSNMRNPQYRLSISQPASVTSVLTNAVILGEKAAKASKVLSCMPEESKHPGRSLTGYSEPYDKATYDIEVDHPDHLFVLANGLIVSNSVADAGFTSKQLALAAQRQVVSHDKPRQYRLPVGLPVSINDPDNEGAVLAVETGGHPAGTLLTPRILEDVRRKVKGDKILIHSPMTSIHEDGGIDRWSAGVRERGRMADKGDNTGIVAAQSLGEPLAQGQLNSKHTVGVGSHPSNRGGFEYLNKLLQAPETFTEAGPLAPVDGTVTGVEEAPQGGHYIHVGSEKIFVRPELNVTVKPGQKLEVGDDLTDGVPHPSDLVRYRGVGEARRVYLSNLLEAVSNSGLPLHRRNAESLVSAIINHARVTDPDGYNDHLIDSVVPYNVLMARYKAREGAKRLAPAKAVGRYLEEPALHYTPGTRINSRVAKELQEFGIGDVDTYEEPPPFEPQFERLMTNTSHDPDWQTRMGGFYIGRSLLKSVHEGATSDSASTSFIPALAQGQRFGKDLKTEGRY